MKMSALASVIIERIRWARQMGLSFNDKRDMFAVLGYPEELTTQMMRARYARGGIAGRIVDAFPNATWRGQFEIIEDEDPEKITPFEQAWLDLDKKFQLKSKLRRTDILSRLSTYSVLLIGAPGELDTPLPEGNGPDSLIYFTPFIGGGGPGYTNNKTVTTEADATIHEFETDVTSPRFGLPKTYQLKRVDVASPLAMKPVHWSRIIHVAEGLLDNEVYGQPALERVWNLLNDLDKVTGGGAEAFWLRANQGTNLQVDADAELTDPEREAMEEKVEEWQHQQRRFMVTRKAKLETLGSDVANFDKPTDAILTQIAGSTSIPKRILTGSEMGELASSQDRDNWRDQVNGRQSEYAGPYIVRALVGRLIEFGYLPTPAEGEDAYNVTWPGIQTLTANERAKGAKDWADINKVSVEATGRPVFLTSEIRDVWADRAPLTDEEIEEEMAVKREQEEAEAQREADRLEREQEDEEVEKLRAAIDAGRIALQ